MRLMVLIHGIPGSSRDWAAVTAGLEGVHEVLAPDLLGFGARADGPRGLWADAQARAIAAQLPAHGEIVLVGHDFGGPVAVHLLELIGDRVRGLVLAAANVLPDAPVPFPLNLVGVPGAPRLLFSGPSLRMMLRGHPDPASALGPASQRAAIRAIFTTALRELAPRYEEVRRRLASADVPSHVIWGDRDPFFTLEQGRRTAEAAGAQLTVVEGAGHFLPHDAPEAFVAALRGL